MSRKNTIKDILEQYEGSINTGDREGAITDIAAPPVIFELKNTARAFSKSLHHSVGQLYTKIERNLNNFSYTLGEIDTSDLDFIEDGEDDFLIKHIATGEYIKNIFISVKFEKVQPQFVQYQEDMLNYRAIVKINEIDPAEFGDLMNGMVDVDPEEDPDNSDPLTGTDDDDIFSEAKSYKNGYYVISYPSFSLTKDTPYPTEDTARKVLRQVERRGDGGDILQMKNGVWYQGGKKVPDQNLLESNQDLHSTINDIHNTLTKAKYSSNRKITKWCDEAEAALKRYKAKDWKGVLKYSPGKDDVKDLIRDGNALLTKYVDEGTHEDGTDKLKKMSDAALRKELKKARKTDTKYYEMLVDEFEKRGISESTKSLKDLADNPVGVGADSAEVSSGGRGVDFFFKDVNDRMSTEKKLKSMGYKTNKMSRWSLSKGHEYPYALTVKESTNTIRDAMDIEEASKDKSGISFNVEVKSGKRVDAVAGDILKAVRSVKDVDKVSKFVIGSAVKEDTDLEEAINIQSRGQVFLAKSGSDKIDINFSGDGLKISVNNETFRVSRSDNLKFIEELTEFLMDYAGR